MAYLMATRKASSMGEAAAVVNAARKGIAYVLRVGFPFFASRLHDSVLSASIAPKFQGDCLFAADRSAVSFAAAPLRCLDACAHVCLCAHIHRFLASQPARG